MFLPYVLTGPTLAALGRTLGAAGRLAPALELRDAPLERAQVVAQGTDLVGARRSQLVEQVAHPRGGVRELVDKLLGAFARHLRLARCGVKGLIDRSPQRVGRRSLALGHR